jgi:hypothetical protein
MPRLTIAFEKQSNSSQPGFSRGSAVLLLVPAFVHVERKSCHDRNRMSRSFLGGRIRPSLAFP